MAAPASETLEQSKTLRWSTNDRGFGSVNASGLEVRGRCCGIPGPSRRGGRSRWRSGTSGRRPGASCSRPYFLEIGPGPVAEGRGEEIGVALLALAPVPARAGQDVRAVDGLDRVLDLDADGQHDVGRLGQHGLDRGHQAQAARAAGALDPDAGLPAQVSDRCRG